jgi:hypothetical protein
MTEKIRVGQIKYVCVNFFFSFNGSPRRSLRDFIFIADVGEVKSGDGKNPPTTTGDKSSETKKVQEASVLRIREVYPRSEFFHPGSRVKKIPDPGSASKKKRIKVF